MAVYDDEKTKVSDDDLRNITGIGEAEEQAMQSRAAEGAADDILEKSGDASTPADLAKAESGAVGGGASSGVSEPQKDEADALGVGDQVGKGYRFEKTRLNIKNARGTVKRLGFVGAITAGIAGLIMSLIGLLLPFKVSAIIDSIEARLGQVPQYAVEQRTQYYMQKYLIMRQLAKAGVPEDQLKRDFVYMGDGFISTYYNNWQGAKMEKKMFDDGIKITPKQNSNPNLLSANRRSHLPSEWEVDIKGEKQNLNTPQMRRFIKEKARETTKSRQVLKRWHMRHIQKNYYGVTNWKPFEKTRGNVRDKYNAKKLAFKKTMVKNTVGKISARYSTYLGCILDGINDDCKDGLKKKSETALNSRDPEVVDEDGNRTSGGGSDVSDKAKATGANIDKESVELLDKEIKGGGVSEKILGKRVTKKIQEIGLKKILASFAAGIGVLDTISQIEKSVSSGALSVVVADKNAQQYASFSATILSGADQLRSGEDFDPEDARVLAETFNDLEDSPVYQSHYKTLDRVVRDCNNDEKLTESEVLKPGELVCPDKKVVQNKEGFTDNPGWAVVQAVSRVYRSSIGKIVSWFGSFGDWVMDKSGLDTLVEKAMNASGLSDQLASAFEGILNWVAGPVLTGAETAGDAYDALYAGMSVNQASLGGGVGIRDGTDGTIGGGYLNDAQVAQLQEIEKESQQRYLAKLSPLERYFSTKVPESITNQAVLATPTTVSGFAQRFVSFIRLPKLTGLFSGFSERAFAADTQNPNPFRILNYGFPADHEIFTANGGSGMDPDEIERKYECKNGVSQLEEIQATSRPDGLPFDVQAKADPCMLDQIALDSATGLFTGEYNAAN